MGTWGVGPFENDVALDWLDELSSCDDLTLIKEAINCALEHPDEYLEADTAFEALAACEITLRLRGSIDDDVVSVIKVDNWVELHPLVPEAELVRTAVLAIDRIRSPSSELVDLWITEPEWDEWLLKLKQRLENLLNGNGGDRPQTIGH